MTLLEPTCNFRCPEKKGTCFPDPCKRYRPPSALEAAKWRVAQCRKTVREGEAELLKRRDAMRQAEIALAELTTEDSQHADDTQEASKPKARATELKDPASPSTRGEG